MDRSTLVTSPRSQLDFALRLVFFVAAPFAIVPVTALFPVWGAVASVLVALVVFVAAETIRGWAASVSFVATIFSRELAIESFYRSRPPRPFLYYVFYPLLFPYWLWNREARREFWLFKGYTIVGLVVLLVSVVVQYFVSWRPDLSVRAYLPVVGLTLLVETLLVLALLMPIATTVIDFHQSMRRRRLLALLLLATLSTVLATAHVMRRRDPIVSYATRQRVRLRTAVAKKKAHDAQIAALRAAWNAQIATANALDVDGKVQGPPLDKAHAVLERFYKHDEAFAFDLWASPLKNPRIMVLYFEARRGKPPIWAAIVKHGTEITDPRQLPKGAFAAMKHAAEE